MATAAFRDWVKAGRPWDPARIVADYAAQLRAAGWTGAALGIIGNEAHLQAETPQDHTPFSATGWPGTHPYPLVLALDVMHDPSAGRDVSPLVEYWLWEARAGRTPWVKYMNWRGQQYDVRSQWVGRNNSGHFDHAHISFRTDYARASVGSWTVVEKRNPVASSEVGRAVWSETVNSPSLGLNAPAGEWLKYTVETSRQVAALTAAVNTLQSAVETLLSRPAGTVDAEALATVLAAHSGFVATLGDAVADRVTGLVSPVDIAHTLGRALLAAQES